MDFRILGPLEAYEGERKLALGGARQRALLGMLLLHPREVVSSDRLIDELWPGEGLAEGSKALQVAVSRLRKALEANGQAGGGGHLIVTRPPGYELQLDPERLDAARFEALAREGREALETDDPAGAAGKLTEALDLWRGEPLADLTYESFCQREIARLEELRAAALEDRMAARLELGDDAELVAELRDLVASMPLRERLRAQLITALYRSGRQAEALEAYADARDALVQELGIEPGRELQELQAAVLRQDRALESVLPDQTAPELSRGAFVGRQRERATLTGALDDAFAGRGSLVLLVGEPGIGKSRLAEELMADARARNAAVIVGRCWEAGGAPAYWPWVQALRGYAREVDADVLREQVGAGARDLAQLLPELHELIPDLPVPQAPDAEGARFRLFEAVAGFLRGIASVSPTVLVLDDLHAADDPSLLLLRFVGRELGQSQLLVVCALRDVDPTLSEPLTATLAELARESHCTRLGLRGLHEADVSEYIELATGAAPSPGLAAAIHAETEGNPLFVAEVVRLLDAEGRIGEPDAHLRIPPGVRAVIGRRLSRLSEPCREVLAPAAVMGREFGLDPLERLTGLSRDELLDLLDEAIGERVVTEAPGAGGRLRFGHALIRDTLYDELGSARKRTLHRDAAQALETVHSGHVEPYLAELAHHYASAAEPGLTGKAVEFAERAAEAASSQHAYEEAVRLYELALAQVEDPAARCALLVGLGYARGRAGDTPASKDLFREAADLAEKLGLTQLLARAALGYGARSAIIWEVSRDDPYLIPLLERAIAALGTDDDPTRVRLLGRLAAGPLRDARFPPVRRHELSEEALAMARRLGEPGTLAYALESYIIANHGPDSAPNALKLATEVVELATTTGDLERELNGHEERFDTLFELGEVDQARVEAEHMDRVAQQLRQPAARWLAESEKAILALFEGRLDEAEAHQSAAHELGGRTLSWNAQVGSRLQLYVIRWQQLRVGEVEELVRRSVAEFDTYPVWRCVLAHMLGLLGSHRECREEFAALAADDFAALPVDEEWMTGMCLLAQTAAALDDADGAAAVYARLEPYAERLALAYMEFSTGSVQRELGLLATTMERWDEAERHLERAIEVNRRTGGRLWLAHSQENYARLLARRGRPGDRESARELLDVAASRFRELGMDAWANGLTDPAGEIAPSRP